MTARKYDVVYFVRPGENNEELRYSLRSLVHLPHRRVWIVGHTPAWVGGVESIPGNVFRDKERNVVDNLRLAALHVEADRFVVMNDDIFLMRRPDLRPLFRGPLTEQIAKTSGAWRASLEKTYAHLASIGIDAPVSYELHRPVVMERAKLLEIARMCLGMGSNPPQWRTLYGNLFRVGGSQVVDGKVQRGGYVDRHRLWQELDVISTEDNIFRHHEAGRFIRATFAGPCEYEQIPETTLRKAPSIRLVGRRHSRGQRRPHPPSVIQKVAV